MQCSFCVDLVSSVQPLVVHLHAVPLLRVPSHAVQLSRGTCHAQSSDRTSSCGALCMQCSFCIDLVSSVQPLVVHFACSAAFAGTFTCSAALTGHLSCTVFRAYVVLWCTLHAVPLSQLPSHAVQLSWRM